MLMTWIRSSIVSLETQKPVFMLFYYNVKELHLTSQCNFYVKSVRFGVTGILSVLCNPGLYQSFACFWASVP